MEKHPLIIKSKTEPNALYAEFDVLISDSQLEFFMDEVYRRYPRVYMELYHRANKVYYVMLELMMERHPRIFNSIMTKALNQPEGG